MCMLNFTSFQPRLNLNLIWLWQQSNPVSSYCQAQPQLQLSWAEMVFNVNLTPPTQPPTQPGKYQASKIKQFMLNGSCQSLGVKLKTVFGPILNNLNSSLRAIIDFKNGKLKIQWISIQHSMHKQFVALYDYSQHNFRPKMLFSWIPAPRTKQTG